MGIHHSKALNIDNTSLRSFATLMWVSLDIMAVIIISASLNRRATLLTEPVFRLLAPIAQHVDLCKYVER